MTSRQECVDALLVCQGSVLLQRRVKYPYAFCWALPGGRVDAEDLSLRDAAVRELHEELGLVVSTGQLTELCVLETPGRDPRAEDSRSTVFLLELSQFPTLVLEPTEVAEVQWFSLSEPLPPLAFDHKDAISLLVAIT